MAVPISYYYSTDSWSRGVYLDSIPDREDVTRILIEMINEWHE